jgi:predicted small integral membrane protein
MFTSNPFAELSAFISPSVQQTYIIVMVILVVAGTVYDTLHKKSAVYFWDNWRKSSARATQKVGGGEMVSIALKTAIVDVAASGEFCSATRRIAHLLTMYGFLAYAIATAVMVFRYPTPDAMMPAIVAQLWHIGALMVCLGGYWFWFFIRVDVAAEGSSPFRIMRADLFVLSLLMSATFALVWSYLQAVDNSWAMAAFSLHIIATTGPSLRICFLNPQRRSRKECQPRTVRGVTCRPLPTNLKRLAAPDISPEITDLPIIVFRNQRNGKSCPRLFI